MRKPLNNFRQRISLSLNATLWLFCSFVYATENQTDSTQNFIADLNISQQHPYLTLGEIADQIENIHNLYQLSQNQLIWLKPGYKHEVIDSIFTLLSLAEDQGLNPEFYDFARLSHKWQQLKATSKPTDKDLLLFDTALNIAILRYQSDLHFGRFRPKNITLDTLYALPPVDLATRIFSVSTQGNTQQLFENLEPTIPVYADLKLALVKYRKAMQELGASPLTLKTSTKLTSNNAQIETLRQLLTALGDLQITETVTHRPNDKNNKAAPADKTLIKGIKHFQQRHNLVINGKLDLPTVTALNKPLEDRIMEIKLSMERFRWLPRLRDTQFIIVNIPAFQLWAYNSIQMQEENPLNMKVVVGESLDKQTPIFLSDMQFLQFRPFWNVPTGIAKAELVPKLRNNPDYLATHDMELVNHFGPNATKYPVNHSTLALLSQGQIKIRQLPGAKNALGTVKFIFPNNFNIYLHDTSNPKLFNRKRRDFSHGCIRVQNPQALAEFVLKSKEDWDTQRIYLAMHKDDTKRVQLKAPIPVIIFYTTVMATKDSEAYFFDDIYGLNKPLTRKFTPINSQPLAPIQPQTVTPSN
ncbi:MAG: L,D-transpeptidase family protein [Methylococcaceae bacterium]|jgi:murein L,D-transpeptidase YcbB/YkuD